MYYFKLILQTHKNHPLSTTYFSDAEIPTAEDIHEMIYTAAEDYEAAMLSNNINITEWTNKCLENSFVKKITKAEFDEHSEDINIFLF